MPTDNGLQRIIGANRIKYATRYERTDLNQGMRMGITKSQKVFGNLLQNQGGGVWDSVSGLKTE